jgi:hypothetical protein
VENVKSALNEIGRKIVRRSRKLYVERETRASGKLGKNLRHRWRKTPDGFKLQIGARGVGYAKYADQGRGPGRMPPPRNIEQWIKDKPVKLRDPKSGRFVAMNQKNIERAAFAIARRIGKRGTFRGSFRGQPRPSEFITDAVGDFTKEILEIQDAFAADIETMLAGKL